MFPFVLVVLAVGGYVWYQRRQAALSSPVATQSQPPQPSVVATLRTVPTGGFLGPEKPEVPLEAKFTTSANLPSLIREKWEEFEQNGQVQFNTKAIVEVAGVGTAWMKFKPGGFGGNASYAWHASRNGQSENGTNSSQSKALGAAVKWLVT